MGGPPADNVRMRVLFVGDTHANAGFWPTYVTPAVEANDVDLVVQVGDFGWWPHANVFLNSARRTPVPTLFIDGNHEHFRQLRTIVEHMEPNADGTVPMGGNLAFVPRGTMLRVGGSRVLFCGGAHSIDRLTRKPDMTWWADEDDTDADVAACVAHGRVDVLVCHDAPNRWSIPGVADSNRMPGRWRAELAACHEGRQQITRVSMPSSPACSSTATTTGPTAVRSTPGGVN